MSFFPLASISRYISGMFKTSSLLFVLLSACSVDVSNKVSELPPVLVIISPLEDEQFDTSDTIDFVGTVLDENLSTTQAEWNVNGAIYTTQVGLSGDVGMSLPLPAGDYTILLTARDENNNLSQVSRHILVVALDSDGDGVPDTLDCAPMDAQYQLLQPWFYDADADGYGDILNFADACVPAVGYVLDGTDCNDTKPDIHPNAAEICDGLDNNCDSRADEAGAYGEQDWFFDADGDGFGDPGQHYYGCLVGSGWVGQGGDCNDVNPMANPGALEVCDGLDNDCDTLSDELGAVGEHTWYYDGDADGYGDAALGILVSCEVLSGYSLEDGDCDDSDAAYHPFVAEWCGDPDLNCDGMAGYPQMYMDYDQDGRGSTVQVSVMGDPCLEVAGASFYPDDCDDNDATVYPGAIEYCDNKDNNCDGAVDELDLNRPPTAWFDADGDGYGGTVYNPSCGILNGYISVAGDCDDSRADVSPGGVEVCDVNNTDENCNGWADDADAVDVQTQSSWYADRDGDSFGDMRDLLLACDMPVQRVADSSDCDDARPDINPNGFEVCDPRDEDEDCDGLTDDRDPSASGQSLWFEDRDGDLYGSTVSSSQCDTPIGYGAVSGDCNDRDAGVNPGIAPDTCNSVDSDCDGLEDEDASRDSEEYSNSVNNDDPTTARWVANGVSSGSISGMNMVLGETDDWYRFYYLADTKRDNISATFNITNLPSSCVAEVYLWNEYVESNGHCAAGLGTRSPCLTTTGLRWNGVGGVLNWLGDAYTPDEDTFMVHVSCPTYSTGLCASTYTLSATLYQ